MKKKIILCSMMLLMLSSCEFINSASNDNISNNQQSGNLSTNSTIDMSHKVLLAYFSCTGTTELVANKIASTIEVTSFKIEPQIPYTSDDLNYNSDCRANREQNDSSSRPGIANEISNIMAYNTLILGYPIWWGKAPKIIYTFLESYDFSNFTIYPFCTSGSSSISGSESELHALSNESIWKSGKRFTKSATEEEIKNWLK